MKRTIKYTSTLLVILLSVASMANAQSLKAGEYTINGTQYEVRESNEYAYFGISRKNRAPLPKNKETINGLPSYYVRTIPTNESVWHQLVLNLLGSQRVSILKQNKETLKATFYFKPNGDIYFMSFRLKSNTKFTLQEIVGIEQELLQKYKATLKSDNNGHLQLAWISINSNLDFSKL